jgi:DNA-binding FadR family transcriptional regulator
VERNRGWIVREYNLTEIKSRLECRLAIEGYATRLAAQRRSEADLEELNRFLNYMEQVDITRLEFNQRILEFHILITRAAQNPTLASMHNQTRMNYWDLSVPIIFSPIEYQTFQEQHRELVDAIKQREADRAETIARDHIQLTTNIIMNAHGLQGHAFQS